MADEKTVAISTGAFAQPCTCQHGPEPLRIEEQTYGVSKEFCAVVGSVGTPTTLPTTPTSTAAVVPLLEVFEIDGNGRLVERSDERADDRADAGGDERGALTITERPL